MAVLLVMGCGGGAGEPRPDALAGTPDASQSVGDMAGQQSNPDLSSAPQPACPGKVVAADADCISPCTLFTYDDGAENDDHVGTDWCATSCAQDSDCPAGQFCDPGIGLPPSGHACVVHCADNATCQALDFMNCQGISGAGSPMSCF